MNMNAFELNSTLNQFLDKKSIKTYNLIDCFSTNKELIHKFLDDKDMSYLELSNLHLKFAVTIRKKNGTFTIDEIAEKLGISPTDLKIVDENTTYYDGTCPENYGELDY